MSGLWARSIFDIELTEKSGLLDLLKKVDNVMAVNCTVINPFTGKFSQRIKNHYDCIFTSEVYSEACKHYSLMQPYLF